MRLTLGKVTQFGFSFHLGSFPENTRLALPPDTSLPRTSLSLPYQGHHAVNPMNPGAFYPGLRCSQPTFVLWWKLLHHPLQRVAGNTFTGKEMQSPGKEYPCGQEPISPGSGFPHLQSEHEQHLLRMRGTHRATSLQPEQQPTSPWGSEAFSGRVAPSSRLC